MSLNKVLFSEILVKVSKIKNLVNQQQKQLESLEQENNMLKNQLLDQTKTIENLKETNKIIKIAEGINLSAKNKTELNLEINRYIKQIDECIKLLSD